MEDLHSLNPFQDEDITALWGWKPLLITLCEHCDAVAIRVRGRGIHTGIGRIGQMDALR